MQLPGGWRIQNPDGSLLDTRYTAFHAGCSYTGFYQSTATAGTYAENKRFTALWKSDYTTSYPPRIRAGRPAAPPRAAVRWWGWSPSRR